ncbi:probable serine hydrolase [Onthophagus taurus]|uniref:probable serine hydrolase n=1 Tax=Onthophagus taurus TaxID=166361 RepID=UPI0039BE4A97
MVLKVFKVSVNNLRNLSMLRSSLEVRIPLASGYLSGKWWGPEDRRPILAFHGWQDNCGTFDRLIPLLPPHIPVLALDFFGHGFSSQIPPGMFYHDIDHCITIKRVKEYFGWEKISLMGHSMGGIATFLYSALFPNDVDIAICIDRLYPLLTNKKDTISKSIEEFIKYDSLNTKGDEPPSYTFDEMVKRTHIGSKSSIDVEVAKFILYRNITPSKKHPGRFFFNRDARVKVGPIDYHDPNEVIQMASRITIPLFLARARDSVFFGRHEIINDLRETLKKSSKDFQFHDVPGTHHCHLNNPDVLAGLLTEFLLTHDRKRQGNSGLKDELKIDENIYPISKYKREILEE